MVLKNATGDSPVHDEVGSPVDASSSDESPANNRQKQGSQLTVSSTYPVSQQSSRREQGPIQLTPHELSNIVELCREVVLDYEAQRRELNTSALAQSEPESGTQEPLYPSGPDRTSDRQLRRKATETYEPRNTRRRKCDQDVFSAYEALRPAYFQELRAASEAAGDNQATYDSSISEEVSRSNTSC